MGVHDILVGVQVLHKTVYELHISCGIDRGRRNAPIALLDGPVLNYEEVIGYVMNTSRFKYVLHG